MYGQLWVPVMERTEFGRPVQSLVLKKKKKKLPGTMDRLVALMGMRQRGHRLLEGSVISQEACSSKTTRQLQLSLNTIWPALPLVVSLAPAVS